MKDFRERHGGNPAGGTTRPSSAASTPRKATPRKRATTTKSKIPVKDEDTEDTAQGEEYDEDSEDLKAQKASIKKQEQQQPAAKKRKLATTSSLEDEFLQPMFVICPLPTLSLLLGGLILTCFGFPNRDDELEI